MEKSDIVISTLESTKRSVDAHIRELKLEKDKALEKLKYIDKQIEEGLKDQAKIVEALAKLSPKEKDLKLGKNKTKGS